MINWKGSVRKRSRNNFKVLCRNLPEKTDESHEKPVRIAGFLAEI
jgi:hypothetical protein